MTDSVLVFPPGFRVLDSNGNPVNGAKIKFFEVGPGVAKNVFADAALGTNLGPIVYTRSDGFPVISSGSNTTTLIYVGPTAYYIVITDANDVALFPAKDNVKGAVDTSTFLTVGSTSTLDIKQTSTAIDLTLTAAHKGRIIAASAALTATLTAAATLGDGWNAIIRNDTAASMVSIASSDVIHTPMGSVSAFAIGPGAACQITCNGASFEIANLTPPYFAANGVLAIVGRVASLPGSPAAGARYIATAVFAATPVTTAIGDIIEATGQGTWLKITPPTDAGWLAFVQNEDSYYSFQNSAWTKPVFSSLQLPAGTILDRAYAEYTATITLTVAIPADDTIPQVGEGTEILSATITPKSVSSRIRITFQGVFATSGAERGTAALFKDGAANAIAATGEGNSAGAPRQLCLVFEHAPATVSLITYSIRAGAHSANIAMNVSAIGTRIYGGASRATLVVEEIAA